MARLGIIWSLAVLHETLSQDAEPAKIDVEPSSRHSQILSAEGATAHMSGQRVLFGGPLCIALTGVGSLSIK